MFPASPEASPRASASASRAVSSRTGALSTRAPAGAAPRVVDTKRVDAMVRRSDAVRAMIAGSREAVAWVSVLRETSLRVSRSPSKRRAPAAPTGPSRLRGSALEVLARIAPSRMMSGANSPTCPALPSPVTELSKIPCPVCRIRLSASTRTPPPSPPSENTLEDRRLNPVRVMRSPNSPTRPALPVAEARETACTVAPSRLRRGARSSTLPASPCAVASARSSLASTSSTVVASREMVPGRSRALALLTVSSRLFSMRRASPLTVTSPAAPVVGPKTDCETLDRVVP